ncbi:MAG TPA: hypothetical protein VFV67_17550, partial [Actinophytocola sp.]|uniref:hypothetical protein n=1 Tax=Actinophytocola sp. TaxID=1872138 RepID=UPI002DBBC988
IGFRYQEAEILWGLGTTQHALGHADEARSYWLHSIAILHEIGSVTAAEAEKLRRQPVPDIPPMIRRNI